MEQLKDAGEFHLNGCQWGKTMGPTLEPLSQEGYIIYNRTPASLYAIGDVWADDLQRGGQNLSNNKVCFPRGH